MIRKFSFLVLAFFVFVCLVNFSGAHGCCVSSDQTQCSANTEQLACSDVEGQYSESDPSCANTIACDAGCCILGSSSASTTRGDCQLQTKSRGFPSMKFLKTNADCSQFSNAQEWGACIVNDNYGGKTCAYLTKAQCPGGNFFLGKLCSEVSGEVQCTKTANTKCFNNGVYFIDSCGNLDAQKEACSYNSGKVCKQTDDNTAICKDVNCLDNIDYSNFLVRALYQSPPTFQQVQRKQGDVWCVTNGNVPFDLKTSQNFKGVEYASGTRFFSKYCVDGEIVTEPCGDLKGEYCSGYSFWYDVNRSTGTGGKCQANLWSSCLSAETKDECDPFNCYWYNPSSVVTSKKQMISDLDISKCLPNIPGGSLSTSIYSSQSSVCSQADYATTITFTNKGGWALKKEQGKQYGNAGILVGSESSWVTRNADYLNGNKLNNIYTVSKGYLDNNKDSKSNLIPLDPNVIAILDDRCSRIGDCQGGYNWVGAISNTSNGLPTISKLASITSTSSALCEFFPALCVPTSVVSNYGSGYPIVYKASWQKPLLTFNFEYKCKPRIMSTTGNCSACQQDGLSCSQYKCNSIGRNCIFHSLEGTEIGGNCMENTDHNPPQINLNCPVVLNGTQSIKISATTSKYSQCKFNIGSSTMQYDMMRYDFGKGWGKDHSTILKVPAMTTKLANVNETEYPLLLSSGDYNIYARCIDPAGNGADSPAVSCTFNVPKNPDNNPPIILAFYPESGSKSKYNSTEKQISFLVNEPVDCRWSTTKDNFDDMENYFNCNSEPTVQQSEDNTLVGFNCSGTLTGISKYGGNITNFNIQCKDQPSLEESETPEYHRNLMPVDTVYSLTTSDKLTIADLSPKGYLYLGPNTKNWTLSVRTAGGANNGVSECKWRIAKSNESLGFSTFFNTKVQTSTQLISTKPEGNYKVDVTCTDEAGNIVSLSTSLGIRVDKSSPTIARIYNDKGNLKIVTSEGAVCKSMKNQNPDTGCFYEFNSGNATLFSVVNKTAQTIPMSKFAKYYIKCQDVFQNGGGDCVIIGSVV